MAREEIRCHADKRLAEIDVEERKLYLWCRFHHDAHEISLQPYLDRMLAHKSEKEQDGGQAPVRLLRLM